MPIRLSMVDPSGQKLRSNKRSAGKLLASRLLWPELHRHILSKVKQSEAKVMIPCHMSRVGSNSVRWSTASMRPCDQLTVLDLPLKSKCEEKDVQRVTENDETRDVHTRVLEVHPSEHSEQSGLNWAMNPPVPEIPKQIRLLNRFFRPFQPKCCMSTTIEIPRSLSYLSHRQSS